MTKDNLPLNAEDLRKLPDDKLKEVLSQLNPKQLEELQYNWNFWARHDQIPPEGDWNTFLALAGRGWGKTKASVEWVREQVKRGHKRIAYICATNSDVEKTFVKGESGILNACWANDKTYKGAHLGIPEWSPTKRTLFWPNGAKVEAFSAEEPERLRGPQFHAAACDELCLVANTKVLTEKGLNNIQDITTMDRVWTRYGLRRVNHAWKTGRRKTWKIQTQDGHTLQGTAGHPVMTQEGWKSLSELRVGESILVLSGVENVGIKPNTITSTGQGFYCTEKSTKPTTGESQKVIKSTTSTTTRLITGLKTWWHSLSENTTDNTNQRVSLSLTSTKQKAQGSCGQTENLSNTTVQSVDHLLNLHAQGQGSVTLTVVPSIITTKSEAEETDVYNIEVEEHHEYFASGILNHNCAWTKDSETWDMLQFTLRLGRHPKVFIATTPKPTKLIRQIMADPKTLVVRGSTFDNEANLAPTFLEAVKRQYEGTRLGKQELYAEVLEEAEGALWNTDTLDACQVDRKDVPELNRIVVAIDPAITANKESDMTGMVVAGVDVNGTVYVLGDYTEKLSPQGWASKAIGLYHQYEADRIVAERNQGGDMVKRTLEVEDETVPIKLVHASRGKMARAEPISALYERGLVKHVRNPADGANLEELETQMRTWEPLGSIGSPDRLDALVWACTELALGSYQRPTMQLVYESAKGLR